MTVAGVKLWGRRIGAVSWDPESNYAAFEYDHDFARSGIEVAPVHMPLGRQIYQFPELARTSFLGLPGMLADSLPDRFGNALIDAWLAAQNRPPGSMNPVERLCYVGRRGMGALEYEPAEGPGPHESELEVAELVKIADTVLRERRELHTGISESAAAINQILQVGTSAGGARAKAVVAFNPETGELRSGQVDLPGGFSHWILKLDGVHSPDDREVGSGRGYGRIEYAYHLMARAAGIEMTECRLLEEGGRAHFMTRRFDRTESGSKLHLQSLAALGHLDFNAAGEHSQEGAVQLMRTLGVLAPALERYYRRACFNIIARNQDDHVKNIAFLMDKDGQWSLSPAYDLTYSFNPLGTWTAVHQMSLNGKRDDFTPDDLASFARACDLKRSRARAIVDEVESAVSRWPDFAAEAGIEPRLAAEIGKHHRLDPG